MIYGNIYCESFSQNDLFDISNPRNSDGLFTPLISLRETLLRLGIEINTPDVRVNEPVSFEIHIDGRILKENTQPKYLIAGESPLINPLNADSEYLKSFRVVFSWNEVALRQQRSVKFLIPNNIVVSDSPSYANRNIFSCMISSNKVAPWVGANDLYSKRIDLIRWYEKNAPALFHLYGRGWGKPSPAFTRSAKFLRRISRLGTQLFGYKPFPSWQGEVSFKSAILSNSKFSYCFENVKDQPNYITEKIFDSFLAGCVPIYWGANNVDEYIPQNCFIDMRRFRDFSEVHRYLTSVSPAEYLQFQQAIADFLRSDEAQLFSIEKFATTVAKSIADDLLQQGLVQSS